MRLRLFLFVALVSVDAANFAYAVCDRNSLIRNGWDGSSVGLNPITLGNMRSMASRVAQGYRNGTNEKNNSPLIAPALMDVLSQRISSLYSEIERLSRTTRANSSEMQTNALAILAPGNVPPFIEPHLPGIESIDYSGRRGDLAAFKRAFIHEAASAIASDLEPYRVARESVSSDAARLRLLQQEYLKAMCWVDTIAEPGAPHPLDSQLQWDQRSRRFTMGPRILVNSHRSNVWYFKEQNLIKPDSGGSDGSPAPRRGAAAD